MSNLDDVIKDILGKMYYDVGETLSEQKLVRKYEGNGTHSNPDEKLNWISKGREGEVSVDTDSMIYNFNTVVPTIKFTVPQGAKIKIRPQVWYNKFEPFNQTQADSLFGNSCKALVNASTTKSKIDPEKQYFFNFSENKRCQPIDNTWKYEAYQKAMMDMNKITYSSEKDWLNKWYNLFLRYYNKTVSNWNNIKKNSNGKIFNDNSSGSVKINLNGQEQKIYSSEFTYSAGCQTITMDQCLRMSWDAIHGRASAGMYSFQTVDTSKSPVVTTNWRGCFPFGSQDFFNKKMEEGGLTKAEEIAKDFVFPWDATYIGFTSDNKNCEIDPNKIFPANITFKLPGNDFGSMDPEQRQKLLSNTEIPMGATIQYDIYGNPYDASASYGESPQVSKEEAEKLKTLRGVMADGAIMAGL